MTNNERESGSPRRQRGSGPSFLDRRGRPRAAEGAGARRFDVETMDEYADEIGRTERAINRKTAQLGKMSTLLYRIDYYTSLPVVSITVVGLFAAMLVIGIVLRFPIAWVNTFEIAVSTVTLLMVFTIQHTQGREQVATQRKLDELLRATPGAAEALMMLEEAPREFMMEVEDFQREVRADLVDADADPDPDRQQSES